MVSVTLVLPGQENNSEYELRRGILDLLLSQMTGQYKVSNLRSQKVLQFNLRRVCINYILPKTRICDWLMTHTNSDLQGIYRWLISPGTLFSKHPSNNCCFCDFDVAGFWHQRYTHWAFTTRVHFPLLAVPVLESFYLSSPFWHVIYVAWPALSPCRVVTTHLKTIGRTFIHTQIYWKGTRTRMCIEHIWLFPCMLFWAIYVNMGPLLKPLGWMKTWAMLCVTSDSPLAGPLNNFWNTVPAVSIVGDWVSNRTKASQRRHEHQAANNSIGI